MMIRFLKRSAAVAAALAMAVCLSGCGSKNSSSSSTVSGGSSANDPVSEYGANMTKHWQKDGYEITTEVDYRFITEDESKKLAKYIAGIGRGDGKLLEEAVHPDALKYVLNASGGMDADSYAKYLHEQLGQYIGEDYEFDYAVVEKCVDENSFDFSKYDKIITDANPDAKITDRKRLSVDGLFDHSNKSLNARMGGYIEVCIYTIDGTPYVLS